jgi:hypothetical protein
MPLAAVLSVLLALVLLPGPVAPAPATGPIFFVSERELLEDELVVARRNLRHLQVNLRGLESGFPPEARRSDREREYFDREKKAVDDLARKVADLEERLARLAKQP